MVVSLTYTNPVGKSVTFYTRRLPDGSHPLYILSYITGVGGPHTEYEELQLTGGDGSTLSETRYPSRPIQTGCMVYGVTDAERDRNLRSLIGVLNPKLGPGTLSYTNHEGRYKTSAKCILLPTFAANTKQLHWKPVLIDYLCPYPFLQGVSAFSTLVAASTESFRLPFKLPFKLGSRKFKATANNTSDVPVPVQIVITGPAVNPIVSNNTTGERMLVRRPIDAGEKLVITTGPIIKVRITSAQGVESDALNYVNLLNTSWIKLMPGLNELSYSSDDAAKNTRIELHWNDWYLGVG